MSSRAEILSTIKRRLAVAESGGDRQLAVKERLESHRQATRPLMSLSAGHERIDQFVDKAKAKGAELHRVDSANELSVLIESIRGGYHCSVTPGTASFGLTGNFQPWTLKSSTDCCVSIAECGISETGTLVLVGDEQNPTSQIFLADNHIVLLSQSEIEDSMESVWKRLRSANIEPRHLTMVSGPSSTGDIELQMEKGVHGPRELNIILLTYEL